MINVQYLYALEYHITFNSLYRASAKLESINDFKTINIICILILNI